MKIQVLGSGCTKCKKLFAEAEKAAAEVDFDVVVEKVEDLDDILDFGVMMTPALVVDGTVRSVGKVVKSADIAKLIREHQS